MTELLLSGNIVGSYFELMGTKENDMTFALGWALSRSSGLQAEILPLIDWPDDLPVAQVRLQQHERNRGFTDIEIVSPFGDLAIIEAKRGWSLPSEEQLERYRAREEMGNEDRFRVLVVLTAYEEDFVAAVIGEALDDVPVTSISWRNVLIAAENAMRATRRVKEKWALGELVSYLEGIIFMQRLNSNRVYVVSLSNNNFSDDPEIRWVDVIADYQQYFHPVGVRGWPAEPPNYIGFRYDGWLQSVHHIDGFRVIDHWGEFDERLNEATEEPLFLYELGEEIPLPEHGIPSGNIRNARLWCHLDLLLTSVSVQEAARRTRERLERGN